MLLTGAQKEAVDRDLLKTVILAVASTINNIPYPEVGDNEHLLCSSDFFTPWRNKLPEVQSLPDHNLKSSGEARRGLVIMQEN